MGVFVSLESTLVGWRYAIECDGITVHGWRPTRSWARRAASRLSHRAHLDVEETSSSEPSVRLILPRRVPEASVSDLFTRPTSDQPERVLAVPPLVRHGHDAPADPSEPAPPTAGDPAARTRLMLPDLRQPASDAQRPA